MKPKKSQFFKVPKNQTNVHVVKTPHNLPQLGATGLQGLHGFHQTSLDVPAVDHVLSTIIITDYLGVSKNSGTPKSSILIGFSIINHPFGDTPIFGNTHFHVVSTIFFPSSSA